MGSILDTYEVHLVFRGKRGEGMRDARYEMDSKSATGGTDEESRFEGSGTPYPVSCIPHSISRIPNFKSRQSCSAIWLDRERVVFLKDS